MSRLSPTKHYTVRHILIAFSHTEDACKAAREATPESTGAPGDTYPGACGPAVVIINEYKDMEFAIFKYEWTFNYYSPEALTTTYMNGTVTIGDQIGGLFNDFVKKMADQIETAQTKISFMIRTFFYDDDGLVVDTKGLVFNMTNLGYSIAAENIHLYAMNFIATYNTLGQDPGISNIYQMTITHKDGALHKDIPSPDGASCGLQFRNDEDQAKSPPRTARLNRSKPMKTLGDVFDAFELELMEQKYEHKRQLQEWLKYVNDDYTKKIEPPKQKRKEGEVPIDYIVDVGQYSGYPVDNRNLPFEQPEQGQDKPGIRSITIHPGTNIVGAIEELMKLSTNVGNDAKPKTPTFFKTNLCCWRRCNGKYDVFIKVKGHKVARNIDGGDDTGPGESAKKPLVLLFQAPDHKLLDIQITSIAGRTDTETGYTPLEKQIQTPEAKVVLGDREQATAERIPEKDFWKTGFSGIRPMMDPKTYGLEDAENVAHVNKLLSHSIYPQLAQLTVRLNGDPDLMSDFQRIPDAVAKDEDGDQAYYLKPECWPAYMQVFIFLKDDASLPDSERPPINPPLYYHDKWYHMHRITTVIDGSNFTHTVELSKTESIG